MHRLAAAPGSPDFADAAVFAFYPNKQTTTGEGGMIVTDDDRVAALCNTMRNQGTGGTGAWPAHDRLSYSHRLDEMSAVLGVVQIGRIGEILESACSDEIVHVVRRKASTRSGSNRPPVPDQRIQWFRQASADQVGAKRRSSRNDIS